MIRLSKSEAKKLGLAKSRHKYQAVPTVVDGIRFASKKEAKRYGELKALQDAGKIEALQTQPPFRLLAFNSFYGYTVLGEYIADFQYFDKAAHKVIVEDVKGFKTPLYRWKKKHVEAQYGIKIVEV